MSRFLAVLLCGLALLVAGCEQEPEVSQVSPADRQQPAVNPPQESPATAMQQQQQPAQQPQSEQQQPAQQQQLAQGEHSTQQQPAAGEMAGGSPAGEAQTAMQEKSSAEQATGSAGGQQSNEFYGQSPEFGNAPEEITLEAKNGNVTFPHKAHADMGLDCKTCHGEAGPGKIEGFGKDKAHELCRGCHQEKGAGPTKCGDCHKKS